MNSLCQNITRAWCESPGSAGGRCGLQPGSGRRRNGPLSGIRALHCIFSKTGGQILNFLLRPGSLQSSLDRSSGCTVGILQQHSVRLNHRMAQSGAVRGEGGTEAAAAGTSVSLPAHSRSMRGVAERRRPLGIGMPVGSHACGQRMNRSHGNAHAASGTSTFHRSHFEPYLILFEPLYLDHWADS